MTVVVQGGDCGCDNLKDRTGQDGSYSAQGIIVLCEGEDVTRLGE